MMLDTAQKAAFAVNGFLLVRRAVPEALVRAAKTKIEAELTADRNIGRLPYYTANSFCPGLIEDGTVFALLRDSGLVDLLEELFGQRATARCNDTAQIALRLPDHKSEPGHWRPHIDGFPAGLNRVPRGTLSRHTALIGVYLSEATRDMGNLTVWPGSHHRIAQFMRDIGAPRYLRQNSAEALLAAAMKTGLGNSEQLTVAPGDAVIAHHLLAHSAAWNLSLQIRYAVYFRLRHCDDDAHDPAPLMSETRFFAGVPW
jgi:ectoine hydroxylase-related dioxygenase (phytanoyl-CoA dioxygenase family)